MKKELTRRDLMGRAGLLLGGAMTLGALSACSDEAASCPEPVTCDPCPDPTCDPCPEPPACPDAAAKLKDFPYEKFIPTGFTLNKALVQQNAYDGYYNGGGCGHGSWSGLLSSLKDAGEPFSQLPEKFGVFGAGGIAVYGSICGAALSGVLWINSIIANAAHRSAMMTELMRWYETHSFPEYQPDGVNVAETAATGTGAGKLVLNWGSESEKPAVTKVAPGSHLCHASVSGWCAAQSPMVNAGGANQPDKKARCARVTADVAGKVADMLNGYLGTGAFGARTFAGLPPAASVTGCTTCHDVAVTAVGSGAKVPASASGMACTTCHPSAEHALPSGHTTQTGCATCHDTTP